jgi:hypothetical protein
MGHAEYSCAFNVSHNGEKGKGRFERNGSINHMHLGLWRAAAFFASAVARDLFGPLSVPSPQPSCAIPSSSIFSKAMVLCAAMAP